MVKKFLDQPKADIWMTRTAEMHMKVPWADTPIEKGFGSISIIMEDRVTPATAHARNNLIGRLEQAHILATLDSKRFLLEEFVKMQQTRPITNPISLLAKQFYGRNDPRALVLTGRLEKSIWNMDFKFVKEGPGKWHLIQKEKIPWYFFIHEYGAQPKVTAKMRGWALNALFWAISRKKKVIKIPKRPFFEKAMKKALRNYSMRCEMAFKMVKEDVENAEIYPPIVTHSDVPLDKLWEYDYYMSPVGLALYMVPPMMAPMLMAWGAFGDLSSFVQGKFTTNLAILYAKAMIIGKMGVSKKMIRRKVRRGIIFRGAD